MSIISNIKSRIHKAQQKNTRKTIDKTKAKEARLQKDLVKAEWQERKVAAMEAERDLKRHRAELSRRERDIKYGPALNVLKSIGKTVGSGIKSGAKVGARSVREHARRGNARVEAYNRSSSSLTGLGRALDKAGAGIRKMERHDTAVRHAEERRPKPDPYHRTGAIHAGHFDVSKMDPRTIEKIRKARGV
jgi:hypothetical protein